MKIAVSPENPRYCCYEDKVIIGKTNIEQKNYDCLVFCVRKVEYVKIPSFIEHICSYSFEKCLKLKRIEFENDSKLRTIDKFAFSSTSLDVIKIPSSVTIIGEFAFYIWSSTSNCCKRPKRIEFEKDFKLRTIEKNAFYSTSIESLTIPSELVELNEGWCDYMPKLTKIAVSPGNPRYCCIDEKMIIGKTNIEQNNYDCLVFCVRDIKHIKIPSFIEFIYAFSYSAIQSIKIPSSVRFIVKYAFMNCNLKIIEIDNPLIISIDQTAFKYCKKTLFMIPVHSPI